MFRLSRFSRPTVVKNRKLSTQVSYVKGRADPPLLEQSVGSLWNRQVVNYTTKELLYNGETDQRLSWRDVDEQANAFARGLVSLGFVKGDRLGVWMPNTTEWLVSQVATAKLGVILVNINPAYRLSELEYVLKLVGVKGLVFTPQVKSSNYVNMLYELFPEVVKHNPYNPLVSAKVPSIQYLINNESGQIPGTSSSIMENVKTESKDMLDETLHPYDPINIQFTSGTTGHPKGATLTHVGILNNGYFVGYNQETSEEDVLCVPVPLYHCFGCVLGNLAAITHGAKLVYPSYVFNARKSLESIDKEKCTSLYGVPTMFNALLHDPAFPNTNLSSVRKGISAGANATPEIMKRLIEKIGMCGISICYGMTETSPVSFQTRMEDTDEDRVDSVGTILQHLEVKVVDQNGNIVPRNTPGELMTKGYSVMKGYWGDTKQTTENIVDGWMKTGDIGVIDDRGYCKIVGRYKDMILRGGENIYPKEIEDFLFAHPNIVDVQVVAIEDELYGEEVCACVIPKEFPRTETEAENFRAEIKLYCKDQISHFKIPRYIIFVDSFPLTITGKVQKFILKDIAKSELSKHKS